MRKFTLPGFAAVLFLAVSWMLPATAALPSAPSSTLIPGLNPGLNEALTPKTEGRTIVIPMPSSGERPSYAVVTELTLPDHWHAYWTNPATVGIPMEASITPVKGFSVSGPYWAVPSRGEGDLGVFYGYEKPRVAFLVKMEEEGAKGEVTTKVVLQMCRDGECLPPEEVSFSASVPPASPEAVSEADLQALNGIVGLHMPSWSTGMKASAFVEGNTVTLALEFPAGAIRESGIPPFLFFSRDGEIMPTVRQEVEKTGVHAYSIKLQRNLNEDSLYPNRKAEDDKPLPPLVKLEGVLALNGEGVNLDLPVSPVAPAHSSTPFSPAPSVGGTSFSGLFSIVIGLFFGGIILNLMPCVFPVIGLKILSFVKLGGGERKKVFSHSLAFVAGVIISFWLITVILVGVKAGLADQGQQITWAFWMEKPYVIFALILIMLIMSLSMYGVFEIGVRATSAGGDLQRKEGYAGSFWSGVLATVVATPCTAPFLSGAMAPALALPSWGMFIAFTGMGLGMSFPYIILGAFPHLVKYLPKPGAWMESFKQGISFILLAAAGWLFWVYIVNFEDPLDLFNAILGLVAICAACWVYGRWCPMYRSRTSRIVGGMIAVILFAGGAWFASPPRSDATPEGGKQTRIEEQSSWKTWSPQAVEEALDAGHPVYVDFTARWCATCLTNKKLAYTPAVMELFKKYGVVLLKADKTQPNAEIDAAMAQLGRAAVPLNVLYLSKDRKPLITREILTAEYMEDFLRDALSPQ